MVDVVDKATRRRMMSGIRGKNTKPELVIRKALFREGFRYRLHAGNLPGKPDIYFPKYRAVIFVHGCFWHRHECHLFRWPASNRAFWKQKITRNRKVDRINEESLRERGLRQAIVWECALKGPAKISLLRVTMKLAKWLRGQRSKVVIAGSTLRIRQRA